MSTENFSTTILVDQTPGVVFNAVANPRGWWSEEIEGGTAKQGDVFKYHYQDVHACTIKLTEVVPDKKIVWHVEENYFKFTKDKSEWTGNNIVFDITSRGNQTELRFTQEGLVPSYECYDVCNEAWTNYIRKSLYELITTGKGEPNPKEGGFNADITKRKNLG